MSPGHLLRNHLSFHMDSSQTLRNEQEPCRRSIGTSQSSYTIGIEIESRSTIMIIGPDGKPIGGTSDGTGPKIVAAFLVFDSMKASTFECAMNLVSSGILCGWSVIRSTLLPTARNIVTTKLLENFPDATHILYLDDDMADFNENHIKSLVNADKDIIAPLMVRRMPPFQPVCNPLGGPDKLLEEIQKPKPQPLECEHVGTGILLAKTSVMRRIPIHTSNSAEPHDEWFTMDRYDEADKIAAGLPSAEMSPKSIVEYTLKQHKTYDMRGEDVYFCNRARSKGAHVWVHAGCQVSHLGSTPFHVGHWINALKQEGKIKCN